MARMCDVINSGCACAAREVAEQVRRVLWAAVSVRPDLQPHHGHAQQRAGTRGCVRRLRRCCHRGQGVWGRVPVHRVLLWRHLPHSTTH